MNPEARTDKLLVRHVGDDLVVYDRILYCAHLLNRTATLVWRHCDGDTTPEELTELLARELNKPADERLTWLALEALNRCRLLKASPTRPGRARISRRQLIRQMGLRGAQVALVPAIVSVLAPTASAAASFKCSGACPCTAPCTCTTDQTTGAMSCF
jgi:hypothetical protein